MLDLTGFIFAFFVSKISAGAIVDSGTDSRKKIA